MSRMSRTAASEPDPLRAALHTMWSSVAPNWVERASAVDERGRVVATALLDAAAVGPGDAVLELACGPGGVGLDAATRVGPTGSVLLSDVAPDMVRAAADRAVERGLTNVATRCLDLEAIDLPDEQVDVVVCREGLMLVQQPAVAAAEARRVLVPGGRAAFAVWGARSDNPWLGSLFDALSEVTGSPVPPEGLPGPFSLDQPTLLAEVLRTGGLDEVTVHEVAVPLRCDSFDQWWGLVPSLAGPVAGLLAAMAPDEVEAVRAASERHLAAFVSSQGYVVPGVSLVGSARRAV